MSQPIYTHLVRSTDGAGERVTSLHESLAEALTEQADRSAIDGHFDVVVMPVTMETIRLTRLGEVVVAYRAAKARHGAGMATRKVGAR